MNAEFQQWRLIFLGFGFLLLLLAPIFSTWVPFYVCSSMAVGVLAVVLLIAFQVFSPLQPFVWSCNKIWLWYHRSEWYEISL